MSIRVRLALLVTVAVALSMAVVLSLAWFRLGQALIARETEKFTARMQVEELRLDASLRAYLHDRVRHVLLRKAQMRDVSARMLALIRTLREADPAFRPDDREIGRLLRALDAAGLRMAGRWSMNSLSVELVRVADLLAGDMNRLGLSANLRSLQQQTVREILVDLPEDGRFAVLKLPGQLAAGGGLLDLPQGVLDTVLVHLVPLAAPPDGRLPEEVLMTSAPLTDLEKLSLEFKKGILHNVRRQYEAMRLAPGGGIALLDGSGTVLLSGGDGVLPDRDSLAGLMKAAKERVTVSSLVPGEDGERLCLLYTIGSLGWSIVLQTPVEAITAPVRTLFVHLALLTGLLMLLVIPAALLVLIRSLRPLQQLTARTERLAQLDISQPDGLEEMENTSRHLDLGRRDELGRLARAYAAMGRALADNIRTLTRETATRERMRSELAQALEIQLGMLPAPDTMQALCRCEAAVVIRPAREVGGDLYDFFRVPDGRIALVVGDVSGKGMPAALFMSMVVTLVRGVLEAGLEPGAAMSRINGLLEARNPGNMFVTLHLGLYDPASGKFCYASGGHCPPLVLSAAGTLRRLDGLSGPVVGCLPDLDYIQFAVTLHAGDLLFVHTDGLTEARSADGGFHGAARMEQVILARGPEGPTILLQALSGAVADFAAGCPQADDITMLAIRRGCGAQAGPGAGARADLSDRTEDTATEGPGAMQGRVS